MSIVLTESQLQTLDAEGPMVRVFDPRSREEYVLISAAEYANVREQLEEERQTRAMCKVAAENALRRMEDDP